MFVEQLQLRRSKSVTTSARVTTPIVDSTSTPYAYGHGYVNCTAAWRDVMTVSVAMRRDADSVSFDPNIAYGSPAYPLGTTSTSNVTKVRTTTTPTRWRISVRRRAAAGRHARIRCRRVRKRRRRRRHRLVLGEFRVGMLRGTRFERGMAQHRRGDREHPGAGTLYYSFGAEFGVRSRRFDQRRRPGVQPGVKSCRLHYALSPSSASIGRAPAAAARRRSAHRGGMRVDREQSASWLAVTSAWSGSGVASASATARRQMPGTTRCSANLNGQGNSSW